MCGAALLEIAVLWVLTFSFEMAIGCMRGRSWQSLLAGYDIAHGGLFQGPCDPRLNVPPWLPILMGPP